jgi:pimeloyl-ACP methyl ester carboxylesterase
MNRHLVGTPEGVLHFRSAGDLSAADQVVMFFHQSPSSSRMWTGVMDVLAERGVCSLASDMFDYGVSDHQTSQLTVEEHVGLLLGAARTLTDARLITVGHHSGAVFAATAAVHEIVHAFMIVGYPLYPTWRDKYERLGGRIGPDRFSGDGSELAELWAKLNASIEPDTPFQTRYDILVDRLMAGPLWFTAYAALMQTDLHGVLADAVATGKPIRAVFAHDDAVSRVEPEVSDMVGSVSVWVKGGAWVTVEHPTRIADVVAGFVEEIT